MGLAKSWMMEMEERGYGPADWSICVEHIHDQYLKRELEAEMTEKDCSFCGKTASDDSAAIAISGESFMYRFMCGVRFLYGKAIDVLSYDSEEGGYVGPQHDTWEVVWTVADELFDATISDNLCDAIIESIGHDTFWTDFGANGSTDDLEYSWGQFSETVKHKQRFVITANDPTNSELGDVARFLRKIAEYVHHDLRLVKQLDIGTILYRARLTNYPNTIRHTAQDLGPAPSEVAAAGRFSPAGISMFYASPDPQIAIAEIAGHGPEHYAVVGEFETLRPLRILDLTRRPSLPSIFDESKHEQFRMLTFLRSFVEHVTEAIIPDGRQYVDYVPTQIIAEYLRYAGTEPIDGLIVPSTQNPMFGQSGRRLGLTYQQNTGTVKENHAYFLDRDEFITVGDGAPEEPVTLEFSRLAPDPGPAIRLDPSKVMIYEVIRKYEGRSVSNSSENLGASE